MRRGKSEARLKQPVEHLPDDTVREFAEALAREEKRRTSR